MAPPRGLNKEKRTAIVDAALAEFSENGFAATSMDRVAARANVSKRTVYNHFPSKDTLFEALTQEWLESAVQSLEQPYNPHESLEHQLKQIALSELDALKSARFLELARVSLVEYTRSPEKARVAYAKFRQNENGLIRWLRHAAQDGRLKIEDATFSAEQFTSLIKAFAFWPQVIADEPAPGEMEREAIVDSAVAMFLNHYSI